MMIIIDCRCRQLFSNKVSLFGLYLAMRWSCCFVFCLLSLVAGKVQFVRETMRLCDLVESEKISITRELQWRSSW